jgi:hypothetical protein
MGLLGAENEVAQRISEAFRAIVEAFRVIVVEGNIVAS